MTENRVFEGLILSVGKLFCKPRYFLLFLFLVENTGLITAKENNKSTVSDEDASQVYETSIFSVKQEKVVIHEANNLLSKCLLHLNPISPGTRLMTMSLLFPCAL